MIIELTENYIPEKIIFRDEQITRIKKTFEDFKKYGTSQNLIIQGYSGSGKTAVIERLKKDLEDYENGVIDSDKLNNKLNGWFGYSSWANTYHFRKDIISKLELSTIKNAKTKDI